MALLGFGVCFGGFFGGEGRRGGQSENLKHLEEVGGLVIALECLSAVRECRLYGTLGRFYRLFWEIFRMIRKIRISRNINCEMERK